ncbi:class E sortase [Microbacterium sp. Marseille-Q6965]|uniref:class E sortase n=1 Tax=Microbacterium sp. Marseille-Q6965 TaxID=2965072 RepID=UPI0021B75D9C|nr:class E sortase [Microbacterium sp. Marseille-Q6965]
MSTVAEPLRARRPPRRASVAGVLGEILITAGVVLLLYVVWQLWIGDVIYGAERNAQGAELSQQWEARADPPPPPVVADPETGEKAWEPPVMPEPGDGERFGVMHVPRWGEDYRMPVAGGVTRAGTLDPIGIGHYPNTEMPGQVGNFALAGHRTTFGKPFAEIASLRVGDAIVVETEDGWFTYRFRTLEYVRPDEVDVLLDVPQAPDVPADEAYITLTACSPRFSLAERIIAYGIFESFQPRAEGAPASLTEGAT